MNNFINRKKQEGFTIIEVLIVLAIAGLIILIVFLAVPALQRNSRNTQRNNDSSQVIAAVNECLTNRNGQTASCDSTGEISGLDTSKLRQLTSVNVYGAVTPAFPGDAATIHIYYGQKCSADGSSTQTGTQRQFVALFNTENSSGGNVARCIES